MAHHVQNAYAPYQKEAGYCLVIDIVVAVSIALLLLLARAGWFILLILPIFAVCTFFLNYLPILRIRRETHEERFATVTVEVLDVKEIRSAAGYWGTILKEIYPKALRVGRCKIFCRDERGQKIVLLCIMSEAKQQLLRDSIDRKQLTNCSVTYGQRSHILQTYNDRGEPADTLNQKL